MSKKFDKLYQEIIYIVFLFLICSLVGGLLESFYLWILNGNFNIGGFLYGPLRPIYGFGSLLLYLIGKKINKNNLVIILNSIFICSFFEYLSGYFLELIFDKKWWDYSMEPFNLHGRISLLNSLIWGVIGIVFIKKIEPYIRKLFNKLDNNVLEKTLKFSIIIFMLDFMMSLYNNFN